jgi:hypothetical protein
MATGNEIKRAFRILLKIVFAHIAAVVCLTPLMALALVAAKHFQWWPFVV